METISLEQAHSGDPELSGAMHHRSRIGPYAVQLKRFLFSSVASIWMFFYIYSPDIRYIPFSPLLPSLALLAYASLRHPSAFLLILKHRALFWFSVIWLLAVVYALSVEGLAATDSGRRLAETYPIVLARVYAECFLVAVGFWAILCARSPRPLEELTRYFFIAVSFQFVFVALMVIFPAWRDYFFLSIAEPIEKLEVGTFLYQTRGYGVASFHLFSYPLFNGLVFFLAAWMAVTRNYWYLTVGIMAIGPIFLNARVGLVFIIILLPSILLTIVPRTSPRAVIRFVSVAALCTVCTAVAVTLVISMGLVPATVLNWAWEGIQEYGAILATGQSSTLNTLVDAHWHVPRGAALWIGEGGYLYRGNDYVGLASDIGYINFLFYGGIYFSVLVYSAYVFLGGVAFRSAKNLVERSIVAGILLGFVAAHFKGIIVGPNPFMKAAMLLLVVIALCGRRFSAVAAGSALWSRDVIPAGRRVF